MFPVKQEVAVPSQRQEVVSPIPPQRETMQMQEDKVEVKEEAAPVPEMKQRRTSPEVEKVEENEPVSYSSEIARYTGGSASSIAGGLGPSSSRLQTATGRERQTPSTQQVNFLDDSALWSCRQYTYTIAAPISEWRAAYRKAAWDLKQAHCILVSYPNTVSTEIVAAALANKLPKVLCDCVSSNGAGAATLVLICKASF